MYPKTRPISRLKEQSDRVDRLGVLCGPGRTADRADRQADSPTLGLRDCSAYADVPGRWRAGQRRDGRSDRAAHDRRNLFLPRRGRNLRPFATSFFRTFWQRNAILEAATDLERRLRHRRRALLAGDFAGAMNWPSRIAGWQVAIYATDLNRSFLDAGGGGQIPGMGPSLHLR